MELSMLSMDLGDNAPISAPTFLFVALQGGFV